MRPSKGQVFGSINRGDGRTAQVVESLGRLELDDPAVFMQRYEASQARRTGGQRGFKLKQGPPGKPVRTVLRMMPAHPNMPPDPIIEVKVHFSLGPQQNTATPCIEP